MSVQARIKELDTRHANLDSQIVQELKHPAYDSIHISSLKKQKFRLKQELIALKRGH